MQSFISRVRDFIGEVVVDTIVALIGWITCMSLLGIAFAAGSWVAPHIGWRGEPEWVGLLSAVTFIWIYEHRNSNSKYDRLIELLTAPRADLK